MALYTKAGRYGVRASQDNTNTKVKSNYWQFFLRKYGKHELCSPSQIDTSGLWDTIW